MKVVGVGYPKTGTKTLGACFRALGLRHTSWDSGRYQAYESGHVDELIEFARDYESFEDLPWCSLYRELDHAYPGCKFVLTVRATEQAWYDSERTHRAEFIPDELMLRSDAAREAAVSAYRAHTNGVRAYFRERPSDLLEVCWERGDRWPELCSFLGVPIPAEPFPHLNRTSPGLLPRLYAERLQQLLADPASRRQDLEAVMGDVMDDLPSMTVDQLQAISDALGISATTIVWRRSIGRAIRDRERAGPPPR